MCLLEIHKDHTKYDLRGAAHHEAGYDSFLTAKVLIRKSAELESSGTYVDYDPKGLIINGDTQTSLESSEKPSAPPILIIDIPSQNATSTQKSVFHQARSGQFRFILLLDFHDRKLTVIIGKSKNTKAKTDRDQAQTSSAFSHPNLFDVLGSQSSQSEDDEYDDEEFFTPDEEVEDVDAPQTLAAMPDEDDLISWTTPPKIKRKVVSSMMPPWDSHFWSHYANRLRVNGTVEGVCILASAKMTEEASSGL